MLRDQRQREAEKKNERFHGWMPSTKTGGLPLRSEPVLPG
jgi:hypothetical protein